MVLWLKTSTRNDIWYSKLNLKKKKKNLKKKKSKLFGHAINHALHCSKVVTNGFHHFLSLQSVYEISSEGFEPIIWQVK